jgi:hypothetical protein
MPQYWSVLLPSGDGSMNTWKRSCRVAPGEERMTPGPPTHVGAKGCATTLAQRRCPASYPAVEEPTLVRSQCRPVPKILQKSIQEIFGVLRAQAACCGSNLRSRIPAARKIAVRLAAPLRADNLVMIPTKTLSGSGSSRRTNSGAGATSASGGACALVEGEGP